MKRAERVGTAIGTALGMVTGFALVLLLASTAGLVAGAVGGGAIALLAVMVGNDGGAAFVRVGPWLGGGVCALVLVVFLVSWFHAWQDELTKRRRDRAIRDMEEP